MDFEVTKSNKFLKKLLKEFTEKEVYPIAKEIDETGRFPRETFEKMAKLGLTGIHTPIEFGGAGGDEFSKIIAVEELSKKCATTGAMLSIHLLFGELIKKFGTNDQKIKYLPMMAEGGKIGAFALTEPNAGSDAGSLKTTALSEDDYYVLNGTKCFITGGGQAEAIIVIASTNPSKKIKGLSAIIVDKNTPGFSIGKIEDKMGIRGSETVELIFENCKIPKSNLLGKEGDGFKISMIGLDGARIGIAAQALGIAEGALSEAIEYSKEREQFGKPISSFQGISWYIAEMATKIEATRHLVNYAAWLKQTGKPHTKEAAMCKYFASETAKFVTDKALQVHGGYGYMREYSLERMLRDAKITEIYEGTSEIHKIVIAKQVIK
ncbi:MAG: acryloyl-CoA reductase [Fusobacteriaceae bacterium]